MAGPSSVGSLAGTFETKRSYDVRIDVIGPHEQAFIDGKPAITSPGRPCAG
jgi:hypothetical protein